MDTAAFVPHQLNAIVFDVIGTLVDEDGTWARVAKRLAGEAGVDDGAALYTAWAEILERLMNAVVDGTAPWRPHRELVSNSAREAITRAGGNPSPAAMALVKNLDSEYPAWPDVAPATAALRKKSLVAGVSNGDLDSLARLANANAISWDAALSTGSVRTFKPAPAAYEFAIDALRLDPARTLFVAAHPWDLRAAAEHGFRTAYIGRPGAQRPSADDRFDLHADDLAVLVESLS
ncbi:haloacid dehalogenase type II [Mycobacterium sp. AT1]|uniref:haloacid dehalogenase type II n=1 Tax=Mycobacterium sp. AT1 TaxID=1961706 RepID=UPI0009AC3077|nr:haloacid dehalogenase type II [Mycobacterium sp. AT1]OPX08029.1 haloacid dehalogenase, type II [Mycobacterium sp. AT1]